MAPNGDPDAPANDPPTYPTGTLEERDEAQRELEELYRNGEGDESKSVQKKRAEIAALEGEISALLIKQKTFIALLTKNIKWALEHGYEISGSDFFHTHIAVRKKSGAIVGLVGHAHELDRKRTDGNYIIFSSVECTTSLLPGGPETGGATLGGSASGGGGGSSGTTGGGASGGRTPPGWKSGYDDPAVQGRENDRCFPSDVKFRLLGKDQKPAKGESELAIEATVNGKTTNVRIAFQIRP